MTTAEQASEGGALPSGRRGGSSHPGEEAAHTALAGPESDAASLHGVKRRRSLLDQPYALASPLILVMAFFFVGPLDPDDHRLVLAIHAVFHRPALVTTNYSDIFYGCVAKLPELCVTFKTYLSTLKFCFIVWAVTLVLGFTLAGSSSSR